MPDEKVPGFGSADAPAKRPRTAGTLTPERARELGSKRKTYSVGNRWPKTGALQRQLFVYAYCANGLNGTRAAIEAGYSPSSADQTARSLLKRPEIAAEVAKFTKAQLHKAQVTAERTIQENAAIAHFDPAEIYNEDGSIRDVREMPRHVRGVIASVQADEVIETDKDGHETRRTITRRIKFWNKGDALEKEFKYHRLYAETPPPPEERHLHFHVERLDAGQRAQLRKLLEAAVTEAHDGAPGED